MPTNVGSRRSSHAIKQLSVTKDDSFEEEEDSEPEEVISLNHDIPKYYLPTFINSKSTIIPRLEP